MIKAAVLGSPIAHSLSPFLPARAYQLLNIQGEYTALETSEATLADRLDMGLRDEWSGFNLTMPLKETIFAYEKCTIDEDAKRIKSVNTVVRSGDEYCATSTDMRAFERLLAEFPVDRVALIGGGGTARAAVGALSGRTKFFDVLLRTPSRVDLLQAISPESHFKVLSMDSSIEGYDVVINTSPAGAADHLAQSLTSADGLYFESLYKPWPTELSFAWKELGGGTLNGVDLLVEQALDAIELMTAQSFDFTSMRSALLEVALASISS